MLLLLANCYMCNIEILNCIINFASRFKEGLATLGVLDEVQKQPLTMRDAFVYAPRVLDATDVEDLFTYEWSAQGSNHFRMERTTQTNFRDFLQDAEGNKLIMLSFAVFNLILLLAVPRNAKPASQCVKVNRYALYRIWADRLLVPNNPIIGSEVVASEGDGQRRTG